MNSTVQPAEPSSTTPLPSGDIVLEFQGVRKTFTSGNRVIDALRDVSLRIRRGAVTGIIGPDGAGKTTLIRLAAALLRPDRGRVIALGRDLSRQAAHIHEYLGYMPQRFGLYEDLSVQENLDLYADLQGLPHSSRPERYEKLMVMTGLGRFTTRLAGRLSGGMKQKLGLACSLLGSPRLLLLDEPTVGVDPLSRRELWNIVYRLVNEEETSVVLTTAYLDEAERCDEVIVLHEGSILGQGHPAEFQRDLEHRVVQLRSDEMSARAIQAMLADHPEAVDTVIQGDSVRVVLSDPHPDTLSALLSPLPHLRVTPVAPRLEDWFVARLTRTTTPSKLSPPRTSRATAGRVQSTIREPVILVRHAQRRFGSFYAVNDISFEVYRGEIFGLLGANGAGKSTTFRMLCGLLPASGGQLTVAGVDLRRAPSAARQRIGYMSQKFSLYRDLSVMQNIRFFSSAYGLSGEERTARNAWALEQFGLAPFAETTSDDLPLGFKQRLALACALMHEPDILFLDEPTSGVDPLARREFWRRITELADTGVTTMVTTHALDEAELCDRIAIMANGRILTLGTPEAIKASVRSETCPTPSLEDAFIALIEAEQARDSAR